MKLVVLADSDIGLKVVRWIADNYPQDLSAVVVTEKNEISALCEERGVPWSVFVSSSGTCDWLAANVGSADLGFLAWWPKILKQPLLSFAANGFINMHPSLLPHGRGKGYNFWALAENTPFGVTLHFVDEGVDTGDIVAAAALPVSWEDTGGTLFHRAQAAIFELFVATYSSIREGKIARTPQPQGVGSFHKAAEMDAKSFLDLDATSTVRELLNLLRARTFPGRPSCWFRDGDDEFNVRLEISRRSNDTVRKV